jgi:thiosulfate/3-mercaptopyruvate sulfurtransferase
MTHLISCQDLNQNLDTIKDLVVIDCRFDLTAPTLGLTQYLADHIPGAHYLHLNDDLSGPIIPNQTGRHPLPTRNLLSHKLGKIGIQKATQVVAYDQNHGAFAARLWWLLRWLGHETVQVLDGGYDRWRAQDHPITNDLPAPQPVPFASQPPLTRIMQQPDWNKPTNQLIDVRDPARFRGEHEPIDPIAGHIPGAMNLPFMDNLENGQFKAAAALAKQFAEAGLADAQSLVCYCGSGVTATQMILALLEAGYPEPALYPGSWSEWILDPAHLAALSDATR